MNNALKGALLSGLVFPGLGQIILKQYKRGTALMITAFASMIVFVVNATQQAFKILENVDLESGAIDFDTISKAATQASNTSDSLMSNFALLLLLFSWIFGIVDAYRIGKKRDLGEQ